MIRNDETDRTNIKQYSGICHICVKIGPAPHGNKFLTVKAILRSVIRRPRKSNFLMAISEETELNPVVLSKIGPWVKLGT